MNNNFKCIDCNHEFLVSQYSLKNDKYWIKNKQLICSKCKSLNIEYINQKTDFSSINFGKFSSGSMEDRQNILKKRSQDHFNREIAEKKRFIDNGAKNKGW